MFEINCVTLSGIETVLLLRFQKPLLPSHFILTAKEATIHFKVFGGVQTSYFKK